MINLFGGIKPERMIELEGLIYKNCKFLPTIEQRFISRAEKFRYKDVVSFINMYSTSSPKPDELKLINELVIAKQMQKEEVLQRIREVKRMERYKKKKSRKGE